jgi:hypothetical protein
MEKVEGKRRSKAKVVKVFFIGHHPWPFNVGVGFAQVFLDSLVGPALKDKL